VASGNPSIDRGSPPMTPVGLARRHLLLRRDRPPRAPITPSTAGPVTRLLLKVAMLTDPVLARLLCLGDLVMARNQLLTLRELARASKATCRIVSERCTIWIITQALAIRQETVDGGCACPRLSFASTG
jgi:hypothetical protein